MRPLAAFFAVALLGGATARAEDPPQGSIGVQLKIEEGKIVVLATVDGSPADKAGLRTGDLLLKIDDYRIKDEIEQGDFAAAVMEIVRHKPGDKIKLTVLRDGKEKVIPVTVGKRSEIFKQSE